MKFFAVLLLVLSATCAQAVEVGERLASWTLLDQFDQPYSLNDELQVLLVARSMAGAKLLAAALDQQPKGYLESRKAVFLADISRMPSVIATAFAVPAMRDYNYRVMLDRSARIVPRYPVKNDAVLWLQLQQGRVQAQQTFTQASALRDALEALAP